jgi:beta-glucanase (GH16 family)
MKTILLLLLMWIPVSVLAHTIKGAEYRSKEFYLYGRFETRLKSANQDGMLTSFFTYNDHYPDSPWNEIDIEILGRYTDDIQFNPITPGQVNHVSHYQSSFNPALGYHDYAFEWTPSYVAWFVDGIEVHRATGPDIEALNISQKIMMNIWPPQYDDWVGAFNIKSLPIFTYYDWASYSAYTPGAGTSGTANNFTLQWRDDFDSFDSTRWDKGNHTFGGNNCDFIPANIVFTDGKLVLCLTSETATGYNDNTPPGALYGRAEPNGVMVRFSELVDPAVAGDPSIYHVTGMVVTSASLLPDSQSVFLTLTGYDTAAIQNILIFGLKDRWVPANVNSALNLVLNKAHPLALPIRINCGGSAYQSYLADQAWGPNVEYGYLEGSVRTNTGTFAGTAEQTLFQSELRGGSRYRVRVPNGKYDVQLHMAETEVSASGKRVFSVYLQGRLAQSRLDLFGAVGPFVAYEPIVQGVEVKDGILEVMFVQETWICTISGITITASTASGVGGESGGPREWSIEQNYPNPFNGQTTILVSLPYSDDLRFAVYDALGRKVAEKSIGRVDAGRHVITWDARDGYGKPVATGVYYAAVSGEKQMRVMRVLLVR